MNSSQQQTPAGGLSLILELDNREGWSLEIVSTRPQAVARLLRGRTLGTAIQTVELIFSICRQAQSQAVSRAAELALGYQVSSAVARMRSSQLWLELLHEHLWTLFISLPEYFGVCAPRQQMAEAGQRLRAAIAAMAGVGSADGRLPAELEDWAIEVLDFLFLGNGFAQPHGELMMMRAEHLDWQSPATLTVPLDPLPEDALYSRLCADSSFAALPLWADRCRETGAIARQRHNPEVAALLDRGWCLQPRLQAILKEVKQLLQGILAGELAEVPLPAPVAGAAGAFFCAQVETARGRLIHGLTIAGDRVHLRDYWIIAPTDWNFHPAGTLPAMVRSLSTRAVTTARQQVGALVALVNPCVGWELHADA